MDTRDTPASTPLNGENVIVCLRGVNEGAQESFFLVMGEGAEVGRSPECEILLGHPTVSRHHCRIDVSGAGVRVKDLGSLNGTWVNGVMRMESWLHQGDVLQIGARDFCIEIISGPGRETHSGPSSAQTTRLLDVDERQPRVANQDDLRQTRSLRSDAP